MKQKPNQVINEIITSYTGWKYDGSCNCDGSKTDKYVLKTETGEYKIKYKYRSEFLISTPKDRWKRFPISELKNKLDEIFQTTKTTVSQKTKIQGIF